MPTDYDKMVQGCRVVWGVGGASEVFEAPGISNVLVKVEDH